MQGQPGIDERHRLGKMQRAERRLWLRGFCRVAGVDEAGLGPLAGPVVAAAVVFPPGAIIEGVDDSKRLNGGRRKELAAAIRERAAAVGVGRAEVAEIDSINVYHAGLLAMRRAVESLGCLPDFLLTDARSIPGLAIPQRAFVRADRCIFSVAAASIIAKTCRDGIMEELDRFYPEYGFSRHKGYPTPEHRRALRLHGASPAHRRSFPALDDACGRFSGLFYRLREMLEGVCSPRDLADFENRLRETLPELSRREAQRLRLCLARRRRTVRTECEGP